jgi:hypothetical protein
MIRLRYSPDQAVYIEGTGDELLSVRDRIRLLAQTGLGEIAFPAEEMGSPAPYDSWLKKLIVSVGTDALMISVEETRELKMVGNVKSLDILASYFDFERDTISGPHLHLEYIPGDKWISEAAEPVVVKHLGRI